MHPSFSIAVRPDRVLLLCAWLGLTLSVGGCEGLGNPVVVIAATQPAQWSGGPLTTVTRAKASSPERWEMLMRQTGGELHHGDRVAPADGVVALVTVRPQWHQPPPATRIPLVTELELADGRIVRRRWTAPAAASVWRAGFALTAPPSTAVTALAR
ncbi:MAG: hypothetical protein ACODAG_03615 [Myxococcota bacterium]